MIYELAVDNTSLVRLLAGSGKQRPLVVKAEFFVAAVQYVRMKT
jgi:hypothetical protein